MIEKLLKLSDELDKKGLHKEADFLDQIIKAAKEGKLTKEQLETLIKIRVIHHTLNQTLKC